MAHVIIADVNIFYQMVQDTLGQGRALTTRSLISSTKEARQFLDFIYDGNGVVKSQHVLSTLYYTLKARGVCNETQAKDAIRAIYGLYDEAEQVITTQADDENKASTKAVELLPTALLGDAPKQIDYEDSMVLGAVFSAVNKGHNVTLWSRDGGLRIAVECLNHPQVEVITI